MKKILSGVCAALVSSTPVFAKTESTASATAVNGPYIGIYGGYDWTDIDDDTTGTSADLNGWDGGVFVGYRLDTLLDVTKGIGIGGGAAIEAFYGISNSDDTAAGINIEKEDEWGVSLRPGLSFFDGMTSGTAIAPYGILGYRNTEFKGTVGGFTGSERYDGFELGIGTQLMAMGSVGLRVEYAHTWYGSEGGVDPDSDDVRLGLSMHF